MSATERQEWGVLGGGMLGLTLAHRLEQRGHRVTVIEAADHLGGLASAWNLGDVVWDRHYHVTLLSDRYLRNLLTELGLEEQLQWVETRTGVFADGRHHSVSNTLELLKLPVLGLVDKLRLGATVFYASKIRRVRRLERITVSDWLIRWSGRRTYERFWLPLLRSKLGDNYRVTSALFIWATIARLYAARRTGLKREMFGYVPGGYARILDVFGQKLSSRGVRIELGQKASSVQRTGSRLRVGLGDGRQREFDRVVMTFPAPLAAPVCNDLSAEEKSSLERIQYQGIVCASVLLKQPLEGFYVTNILDDSVPFTGVIEMSALVDRRHFDGHALVYLPRYIPSDDPLFEASDEEIQETFVDALLRMYPQLTRQDVVCFRISRVRRVLALATLDYSQSLPPMRTSIPGLFLVNSAHIVAGTLNVNETVQLAERSLETLLQS